jgi:uncharacterized membrane protein
MRQSFSRQLLLLLFAASVLGTGLVVVRFLASGRFNYFNLIWNLFLAWVPVGFSMLAWKLKSSRAAMFFCGFFWLLFFPNSPYLVTDLVHLRERPPVPFWFDLVLLQSFVLLGLALGFVSLHKMQSLVANLCGSRVGWIFVVVVLGLTGFGIYLGRVQRWNSWDLIVSPLALLTDIFHLLFRPHRRAVGIYSLLHAGFLLVAYGSLYSLTRFNFEEISPSNRAPK